mgnify:CR=1 FL=1
MIELNNKNKRNVFSGVGIAVLLCALMVLMSWSATVSNGDVAQNSSIVSDEKSTDNLLTEDNNLEEETEETGYDPEMEMLGMRTENSKTYVTDSGTATVYSSEPLHMQNEYGEWTDIDYNIVVSQEGYSVANAPVDVDFGIDVEDGFSIELSDGIVLDSGVGVTMVDMSPIGISLSAVNGMGDKGLESFVINEIQTSTTQDVAVGGNEINYPMTDEISVLYTTSEGEVKQEIVISEITSQLKNSITMTGSEGYLGFYEIMNLPSGYYLSSDGVALSNVNLFETDKGLLIHNEIGKVVGSIMEPVVLEHAENKEQETDDGIRSNETFTKTVVSWSNPFKLVAQQHM